MRACFVCIIVLAFLTILINSNAAPFQGSLTDLSGEAVDPFETPSKAIILIFVATDCPISNRYTPALNTLYDEFSPKGFNFWTVYSDSTATIKSIEEHRKSFSIQIPALQDRSQRLATLIQASVTPEVFVFRTQDIDQDNKPWIYRGRIDDRYVEFGRWRPSPEREDLKETLQAIDQEIPLSKRETKAIGCYISR